MHVNDLFVHYYMYKILGLAHEILLAIKPSLTLEAPRKNASENVVCGSRLL